MTLKRSHTSANSHDDENLHSPSSMFSSSSPSPPALMTSTMKEDEENHGLHESISTVELDEEIINNSISGCSSDKLSELPDNNDENDEFPSKNPKMAKRVDKRKSMRPSYFNLNQDRQKLVSTFSIDSIITKQVDDSFRQAEENSQDESFDDHNSQTNLSTNILSEFTKTKDSLMKFISTNILKQNNSKGPRFDQILQNFTNSQGNFLACPTAQNLFPLMNQNFRTDFINNLFNNGNQSSNESQLHQKGFEDKGKNDSLRNGNDAKKRSTGSTKNRHSQEVPRNDIRVGGDSCRPSSCRSFNGTGSMAPIQCHLDTRDLWEKFNDLGTEMIITKSGRRMFPVIRVSLSNLQLDTKYLVIMDIVPVDNKRYRYAYHKSSWLTAGKADPEMHQRCYVHPDSPFTGDQLAKQTVSFEKLKLTNNVLDKHGYIILNSMHKYQPRIHVIKSTSSEQFTALPMKPLDSIPSDEIKTFEFPETVFIAVTAYQNQLITKLKIDCNPFAKGFRDSSRLSEFERESMESLLAQQTAAASAATGLPNPFRFPNNSPSSNQSTSQLNPNNGVLSSPSSSSTTTTLTNSSISPCSIGNMSKNHSDTLSPSSSNLLNSLTKNMLNINSENNNSELIMQLANAITSFNDAKGKLSANQSPIQQYLDNFMKQSKDQTILPNILNNFKLPQFTENLK